MLIELLNKNLKVNGYGVWNLYRGTDLIPESEVKAIIIEAIKDNPTVKRVFDVAGEDARYMAITADYSQDHENLIFDFGGEFEIGLKELLATAGIRVTGPRKVSRQAAERLAQRQADLTAKLELIPGTPVHIYLRHVNQCGFLLSRTKLYFVHTRKQWTASVKTSILDLTIEQLRLFSDATGSWSLATLKPHAEITGDDNRKSILATTRDFAVAIVDFLNLEFIVDVDSILAEYAELVGDSNFQHLSEWGGTREIVLQRLIERKPDMDAETIAEYFNAGFNGELV